MLSHASLPNDIDALKAMIVERDEMMLDLREQTVRTYRKTMMKKLGVNNAPGLTRLAFSIGLMQLPRGQAAGDPE